MSVRFIHGDKLADAFRKLPDKMNAMLDDALKKTGEEIRDEAKRLAPVRTGALRESIRLRVRRKRGGGPLTVKVLADYPRQRVHHRLRRSSPVGCSDRLRRRRREYYAFAVEYGTYRHAPQPFLMPAARKAEAGLEQRVSSTMDIVLDKELRT